MKRQMGWEEILALPPVITIPTLGRVYGLSEPVARERYRRGEWAEMGIRINKLGQQYRVVTADVWRLLGIDPAVAAAPGAGSGLASTQGAG